MKIRFLILAMLLWAAFLLPAIPAQSQTLVVPIRWLATLPVTCVPTARNNALVYKVGFGMYRCSATDTWTLLTSDGAFPSAVLGANGSASAPSYSFSSDTNTGVYRSAADTLGFATAGTGWWILNSAGSLVGRDTAYTNATNGWNPATQVSNIQLGDSSTVFTEGKSVYGFFADVQRGQAGAGNHQTSGIRARANIARSSGSGTTTGGEFFAGNIGDTVGTSALQGSEGVAIVTNTGFSAVGMEAFANTAGVTANTLTNLYGFKATNSSAASWTVTNVHGLQYTSALAGAAVTNLYGIKFSGWTGTAVTNSYGLYMDNSIDRGTTLKYAIYSEATSPSLLTGDLFINSAKFYITTPQTPASAAAACTIGQLAWDTSFIYVCVATNTWKRVAIATW